MREREREREREKRERERERRERERGEKRERGLNYHRKDHIDLEERKQIVFICVKTSS